MFHNFKCNALRLFILRIIESDSSVSRGEGGLWAEVPPISLCYFFNQCIRIYITKSSICKLLKMCISGQNCSFVKTLLMYHISEWRQGFKMVFLISQAHPVNISGYATWIKCCISHCIPQQYTKILVNWKLGSCYHFNVAHSDPINRRTL